MPPNTVKVDRTTKWGNPFIVGRHGTRNECVNLFAQLCQGYLCLTNGPRVVAQRTYLRMGKREIHKLVGKNLACWCPLDQPCHADLLLEAARQAYAKQKAQAA